MPGTRRNATSVHHARLTTTPLAPPVYTSRSAIITGYRRTDTWHLACGPGPYCSAPETILTPICDAPPFAGLQLLFTALYGQQATETELAATNTFLRSVRSDHKLSIPTLLLDAYLTEQVTEKKPPPKTFRLPPSKTRPRILLYHLWPNATNSCWRRCLADLKPYLARFHQRLIAVATDADTVTVDEVNRELRHCHCTFVPVPNDRHAGQTSSLYALLDAAHHSASDAILYYAHAKGCSYGDTNPISSANDAWRRTLYHDLLNDPHAIQHLLESHDTVGPMLTTAPHAYTAPAHRLLRAVPYFFAGGCFAANARAVFGNPHWPDIEYDYYSAEIFPARIVPLHLACSLRTVSDPHRPPNFYDETLYPFFRKRRTTSPPITVITRCMGRLDHLRESLPLWILQTCRPAEIILVAYGKDEPSATWCENTYPSVRVIRCPQQTHWNDGHTRNIGASAARTKLLFFADADFLPDENCLHRASNAYRAGIDLWIQAEPQHEHIARHGSCLATKQTWQHLRGYDESNPGWGWTDVDFYRRAESLAVPTGHNWIWRSIPHTNESRSENCGTKDFTTNSRESFSWFQAASADATRIVNPNGFGRFEP